jgi:hypothetical protein
VEEKMSLSAMLTVAKAEVGYLEKKSAAQLDDKTANAGSSNYTKYARDIWPSLQGQPWCDIFVSWCAAQAGETAAVGKYAYCPSHVQFFKSKSCYFTRGEKTPQTGDIIFFQSGGVACHVGVVTGVSGSKVSTVEGNTSSGSTLVANGGGVFAKSYSLTSSYILGYGRPAYSDATTTTTVAKTATNTKTKEDYETVKTWKNGSTEEPVYADTAKKTKVGSLNPKETCDCLGKIDGMYIVRYKVDGTSHYKVGVVAYAGGIG